MEVDLVTDVHPSKIPEEMEIENGENSMELFPLMQLLEEISLKDHHDGNCYNNEPNATESVG